MFKKINLASKLAIIIGVILTIIFVLLIAVTAVLSGSSIMAATAAELNAISQSNAHQIQQVFDAAGMVAENMESYLEKNYRIAAEDPTQTIMPKSLEAIQMCWSSIYDQPLSPLNYDVEQYLSESARSTAINNADIAGIGAMFEPYMFQNDIEDYAFYVDQSNATGDIEPFETYAEYSKEIYYQDAVNARQAIVTSPYDSNGTKMVSYASPIIYNNEIKGVVMADINVSNFNKVQATSNRYPSMYATIYDEDGQIIYDSDDIANVGKTMADFTPNQAELSSVQTLMAQGQAFQIEVVREDGKKTTKFFTPIGAGAERWWSLTAIATADINKSVNQTIILLIVLAVAALLVLICITIFVLRKMLRPMKDIVYAAECISNGNLDVHLSTNTEDEIGTLSNTFQKMSDNLKRMVNDIGYLLGEIADGNFNVRTKEESSYVGDFTKLLLSMRKLNQRLSETLSQINQSADQVASGSDQVSGGAQALSQGATEQASSVEELAATVNEISGQVKSNANAASRASDRAAEAGDQVNASNQQMKTMIDAMGDIGERSQQISKIIKTINDIAFQTNILSLNAAVEAARAGAAGKGFAVVASEVKQLAEKSAEAVKETTVLIEGTVAAVENGAQLSAQTADSLQMVVNAVRETSDIINQIAQASNVQATAIEQVTQGIDQISGVVQTNSATAEESAAASQELSSQAQVLKELVGQFKLKEEN